MFFIDTKGGRTVEEGEAEEVAGGEKTHQVEDDCAWKDEDDDHVHANIAAKPLLRKLRQDENETLLSSAEYTSRLKKHRSGLVKAPKWAEAAKKQREEEGDAAAADGFESYQPGSLDRALMSNSVSAATAGKSEMLMPDTLNISKTQEIRVPGATLNCLESVHFHPTNPSVLLTSGLDKTLHLFKLDSATHDCMYSARFTDMPVAASCFTAGGEEIFAVGRRPFFYTVDVAKEHVSRVSGVKGRSERQWTKICASPCGKFIFLAGEEGCIIVLSAKTKQWISNLRMNEPVQALCTSADGKYLLSAGQGSVVYIWDLSSLKCIRRFTDNGGTLATALGVSDDGSLLSVGSYSGIVNVYDFQSILTSSSNSASMSTNVSPLKCYENLLTPIAGTTFHPSSQMLSIYSREKRNALRMIHYPSGRVYTNWPTERSPLGRVVDVAFNCTGSTAAFGNKDGVVQIYNLKHFSI